MVASLPTIQNFEGMQLKQAGQSGYKATFNPTLLLYNIGLPNRFVRAPADTLNIHGR